MWSASLRVRARAGGALCALAAALLPACTRPGHRVRTTTGHAEAVVGEYTFEDVVRLSRLNPTMPSLTEFRAVPPPPELTQRMRALPLRVRAWNQVPSVAGVWLTTDRDDVIGFTKEFDLFVLERENMFLRWAQHLEKPLHPEIPPVASDNYVFAMTLDNELWCFNRRVGELRWRRLISPWTPATPMAANDDFVYFGVYEKNGLVAFNVAYETFTNEFTDTLYPITLRVPPVADRDSVFFSGGNRFLYGLERDCSNARWTVSLEGVPRFAPVLTKDSLYLSGGDQNLYALDKAGRVKWYWRSNGRMVDGPAQSGDHVFVSNEELIGGETRRFFNCVQRQWYIADANKNLAESFWDPVPEETARARRDPAAFTRDPKNGSWRALLDARFLAKGERSVYALAPEGFMIRLALKDGSFDRTADVFPTADVSFWVSDATDEPFTVLAAFAHGYLFLLSE